MAKSDHDLIYYTDFDILLMGVDGLHYEETEKILKISHIL